MAEPSQVGRGMGTTAFLRPQPADSQARLLICSPLSLWMGISHSRAGAVEFSGNWWWGQGPKGQQQQHQELGGGSLGCCCPTERWDGRIGGCVNGERRKEREERLFPQTQDWTGGKDWPVRAVGSSLGDESRSVGSSHHQPLLTAKFSRLGLLK